MVRGCIDVLTHQEVSGWAAPDAGEGIDSRYVHIVLDGVNVATVRADQFRSDLKELGISNGHSGFRFFFPSTPNPMVDHVVEIRDRDTGAPITPCPMTLPSMLDAKSGLIFNPGMATTHIRTASFSNGSWNIQAELLGSKKFECGPSVSNGTIEEISLSSEPDVFLGALGIYRRVVNCRIRGNEQSKVVFLDLLRDPKQSGDQEAVCQIAIPATIPEYLTGISSENMTRVSGPGVTLDLFASSGVNTAFRLDSLLRRHFGNGFEAYERIFDWGIGAGRVGLPIKRLIAPYSNVLGSDVDELNVRFGKQQNADIDFVHSPYYPPLPFKDGSFDVAYGISVMTHLTEGAQIAWLKELRRIVKRGAPVVLTVHGEYAIFDVARRNVGVLQSALARGISDQMLDMNLGPKLKDKFYYRSTFHTKKYVADVWSEFFDVVAHYSCANVIVQDFVVLRAK